MANHCKYREMEMSKLSIAVIDIGSINQGNVGWAFLDPDGQHTTGGDLDAFLERVAEASASQPITLGYEAPMYLPTRDDRSQLQRGRLNERSPVWCGRAGAMVMVQALPIVVYTLSRLRRMLPNASASMNWSPLPAQPGAFLLFEAFVSGEGKRRHRCEGVEGHEADALCAARELRQRVSAGCTVTSDLGVEAVLSLLGAAMLRTNWASDASVLGEQCLVVRP
jgi:hypothetical protein